MTTKKEHKQAKKQDGTLKAKYKDMPRFPKVQDKYEAAYKKPYEDMITATMTEVKKIMKKSV
jgi:hypothetical protein